MAGVIHNEDFHIETGRATEGRMFLRIVHEPTQVNRTVVGLKGRPYTEVVQDLLAAVLQEIEAAGWRKPPGENGDDLLSFYSPYRVSHTTSG